MTLTRYWQDRYPSYQLAPHIQTLIRALEDLKPGEGLIINMPPRHSKSETVRAALEYWIGQDPHQTVIYGSYTLRLAQKSARQIRNEILFGQAFRRHFPSVQISRDSKSSMQWATEAGGEFLAVGVGGSVTGFGASILVVDDPVKSREQAESATSREKTIDWFKADILTRLTPDARAIIIQTRWHTNDLTGWLEQELAEDPIQGGLTWKQITMPAISEAGEALWPERYPIQKLRNLQRTLGEYDFQALYQQTPFLKGGNLFVDNPERYTTPMQDGKLGIFVDTASSKRETADFTSILVGKFSGKDETACGDVLEVVHKRLNLLELGAVLKEMQGRLGCLIYMEQTAQSLPIIQYLQSIHLRVKGVVPRGDKFTRAVPASAAWNSGRIRIPVSAPWVGSFLAEIVAFKGDGSEEHDDQVDSLSLFWSEMTAPVAQQQTTRRPVYRGY